MSWYNIFWLIVCLAGILFGSVIIALIIHALGLPSAFGTLFGGILGFWLFTVYMEKTM